MKPPYSKIVGKFAESHARRYSYDLRLKLVKDILKDFNLSNGNILDIGSADGDYANDLSLINYNLTCIDKCLKRLKDGRHNYIGPNFVCADAHNLPFPDKLFDSVIILNTLRYIPNPSRFLLESKRVLDNNGLLILICHNKECLDTKVVKDFEVVQYFSMQTLIKIFLQNGFEIVNKDYILIPPPQFPPLFLKSVPKIEAFLRELRLSWIFPELFIVAKKIL
jgi:ubiquinone/menaquinone biosynthesis C-methylase UbiE